MVREFAVVVTAPILVLLLAAAIAIAPGTHAEKHAEAPMVRQVYRDQACEGVELHYSPTQGTLLVLCGLPRSAGDGAGLWGGLIYRISENGGKTLLYDESYEVTVFAARRSYWDNVIRRDGYVMLGMVPSIERYVHDYCTD
jgi:hypothetical protein